MNSSAINSRATSVLSIPHALMFLGIAIALNIIPLSMAFYQYTSAGEWKNIPGAAVDASHPPLEGNFFQKLETVVKYLIHPAQKEKAIWLKICLVTIPLGFLIIIYGFSKGPLRYINPLFGGLAFGAGLNHTLLLINWQYPGTIPKSVFIGSTVLGLLAIAIGFVLTMRRSILLRTAYQLAMCTLFALLITLAYPFILFGMAIFLKKKRDIPCSEFLAESGNFYNFLILNIYPIFFQILPGLRMVKGKAKEEAKLSRKKYRRTELPKYASKIDFDKLKIGDVILTGRPSWRNSAAIQASNLLSCGEDHRYWSHAVIFAGCRPGHEVPPDAPRRNIVEAQSNGKGVQEIDLLTGEKIIYDFVDGSDQPVIKEYSEQEKREFNYDEKGNRKVFTKKQRRAFTKREEDLCFEKSYLDEGYYLMVLRHKYVNSETLDKVVEFCRKKDGEGFGYDTWGVSFYSLCALVPPMLSGWLEDRMAAKIFNVGNAYFCSELVADAFLSRKQKLFDRSPWRVKPLDFRLNPLFEEVDCGYQRIPLNDSAQAEVAEDKARLEKLEQEALKFAAASKGAKKDEWEMIAYNFKQAAICVERGRYPAYPIFDDPVI